MGLTKKQHQILADNFTAEQVGFLIPIIAMMQNTDSFEMGVSQLKVLDLYKNLLDFLKEQTYHLDTSDENILKYAVANKLCVTNNEYTRPAMGYRRFSCLTYFQKMYIPHKTIAKKHEHLDTQINYISLPLFSNRLDLQFNIIEWVALSQQETLVHGSIDILNAQNIDYPITLDCSPSQLHNIPKSVASLDLEITDNITLPTLKNILTTQVPESLKHLKLRLYNELELDDVLSIFVNLSSFTVIGVQFLKGVTKLPTSVKQLTLKTTRRLAQFSESNTINLIMNNPKIDNLSLCSKTCKEEVVVQVKQLGFELCDANQPQVKEFINFYKIYE